MFMTLYKQARSFVTSKEAVTAIEYAVVAVAIAGIVAAVFSDTGTLKTALDTAMTNVSNAISAATGTGTEASGD
ncbi:MAG: Flp family type IVb pilin [Pseudomonadota bacterium]|nr:Flp family type IVb pilin [Pseudomonadota bacterium]MEC8485101.1 Flp family type IVb pilin [Pseudomonadota bacterium]